jgi:hypothetical protein
MSLSHLRLCTSFKILTKLRARTFHNVKKGPEHTGGAYYDQYAAHSPLQHSRFKIDEKKSKIFFEHPPIPNRIPKFIMLFMLMAVFSTGVRDKILRRNKKFLREEENKLFRQIMPFVQAMEDVRFTAMDQKNYMVLKAMVDTLQPGNFENIRHRFNQEDIYVPEIITYARSGTSAWPGSYNQTATHPFVSMAPNTFYDKGLFDCREVGYIY